MNEQNTTTKITGWEKIKLGDDKYFDRFSGDTPKINNDENWNGDILWLSNSEVEDGKVNLLFNTERKITKKGLKNCTAKVVPKYSVILSCTASIGKVAINKKEMATNQQFNSFKVKNGFNLYFLANQLLSRKEELEAMGGSSTHNHLPVYILNKMDIYKPPLPEQRKIATVLYNVDQAIQKTEDIIEQTKRVKKGLMQDLFTEGYYDHETVEGNVRWKKIPKEWDFIPLNEVVTTNPRYDKPDREIAYIEMDAVNEDLPHPDYIGRRNPQNSSGRRFSEKDTLFARITPCTENGKICFVDEIDTELGIASTELTVLSPESDKILPKFLYHYTRTYTVRDYAISRMRGSTGRQRVPFSVFKKELKIPLPEKKEQREIIKVLDNIDNEKTNLWDHKKQLKRLKKGLMQDLLTGEVRTHNKDIEVLDEIMEVEQGGS